uniref:retropepsin-like aspartic protease family protein n=1 Tax=Sphingomonas sp. TaxID=28214 RepID=UPI0025E8797D|nr:TIGR02281 family clan AA aspartic protease [Sphingomonas sp.]
MNDRGFDVAYLALILILPLSALIARRLALGSTVKMALAWAAIFGVLTIIVGNWGRVVPLIQPVADTLGISDQSVSGSTVQIRMAQDGHFWANVMINGVQRRMLVDSGATTTALSSSTAKAARLDLNASIVPTMLDTANGPVTAQRTTIARLDIGSISATELPTVVSSAFGETDVIGMNFLSRLKSWRVEGNILVFEPKG